MHAPCGITLKTELAMQPKRETRKRETTQRENNSCGIMSKQERPKQTEQESSSTESHTPLAAGITSHLEKRDVYTVDATPINVQNPMLEHRPRQESRDASMNPPPQVPDQCHNTLAEL